MSVFLYLDKRLSGVSPAEAFAVRAASDLKRVINYVRSTCWRPEVRALHSPLQIKIALEWPVYLYSRRAASTMPLGPTIVLSPSWRRVDCAQTIAHEMGHHFHRDRSIAVRKGRPAVALPRRVARLQKTWLAEANSAYAHRHAAYFSTISQGPGRVLGCSAPWTKAGPASRTSHSGWSEFLAEAFALFAMQGRQISARGARSNARFQAAFAQTLRAYWKTFHGSRFPERMRTTINAAARQRARSATAEFKGTR